MGSYFNIFWLVVGLKMDVEVLPQIEETIGLLKHLKNIIHKYFYDYYINLSGSNHYVVSCDYIQYNSTIHSDN